MATGHLKKPRENKDGSKSYQIVIELDPDPITGKRIRHYKTIEGTKKQANAKLLELLAQYNSGNVVNTTKHIYPRTAKYGQRSRRKIDNILFD